MANACFFCERDSETGIQYFGVYAIGLKGERQVWSGTREDDAFDVLDMLDAWTPEDVDERDDLEDALDAFQAGTIAAYEAARKAELADDDRDEALEMIRPGIDCPRCGDEFDEFRCRRAPGSDRCLECCNEIDPPCEAVAEANGEREDGKLWAGVDMTTYDRMD